MLLKWILRNKYKLMALIIGLYVFADIMQHKGELRLLFPKKFPDYKTDNSRPVKKNALINKGKEWIKAVNTKESLDKIDQQASGIECDIYFDILKKVFHIHHDPGKETGFTLDELLEERSRRGLHMAIWLDLKNLGDSNHFAALKELSWLRNKYGLDNKLLVESGRADLLVPFSDSGFYTSYYVPFFNPYLINKDETKAWVDSLITVMNGSRLNAVSGYYFQYPFLHRYFPGYPILTWAENERFSLVNWLFRRKLEVSGELFIVLYPQ